jgi:hypothetical protein
MFLLRLDTYRLPGTWELLLQGPRGPDLTAYTKSELILTDYQNWKKMNVKDVNSLLCPGRAIVQGHQPWQPCPATGGKMKRRGDLGTGNGAPELLIAVIVRIGF